jgi:hypothetical protein
MKLKHCLIGLVLTVLGGVLAGLSFSFIASRAVAGAVAGGGFLVVGAYLLWISARAPRPYTWITFYTSLIHLFVISVPMLVVRWWQPDVHFSQLSIWGVPGLQFHLYSMYFYRVVLVGIVVDAIRAWWIARKK